MIFFLIFGDVIYNSENTPKDFPRSEKCTRAQISVGSLVSGLFADLLGCADTKTWGFGMYLGLWRVSSISILKHSTYPENKYTINIQYIHKVGIFLCPSVVLVDSGPGW